MRFMGRPKWRGRVSHVYYNGMNGLAGGEQGLLSSHLCSAKLNILFFLFCPYPDGKLLAGFHPRMDDSAPAQSHRQRPMWPNLLQRCSSTDWADVRVPRRAGPYLEYRSFR